MHLNPVKIEALAGCLRGCFGAQEFSAGDILDRFAALPLKQRKNSALKSAVRALISGRLTKQRLGQLFNRDIVTDGVSWTGAEWRIEARHDTGEMAWRYRIVKAVSAAESKAMLQEIKDEIAEKELALEEKIERLPIDKAFKLVEREERKNKRALDRHEQSLTRAEEAASRREHDKIARQLDKAQDEYRRVSGGADLFPQKPGRGEELDRRIQAYRAETERLRGSADYARIVAELKKTPHLRGRTDADYMVRQVMEIEQLRGRQWLAGMSLTPSDYRDFTSGRVSAAGLGQSSLQDPVRLRGAGWDPYKF